MIKILEFDTPSINGTVYPSCSKNQVIESLKQQGYAVVEKDNSIYIEVPSDKKLK